ncbi:MAG TPA: class I lanthipeptide [Chitinophaga sp.]|uniref:class I lanthipeptide n=1 Tax=Chitinophaga sp. TaxID=1869181 RepID=UPI002BDEBB4D|nr:class I lanthipeptide [Chitinophaga sp.]HVI49421.1 class I lanthipeptide [Chitinophaga sp.]
MKKKALSSKLSLTKKIVHALSPGAANQIKGEGGSWPSICVLLSCLTCKPQCKNSD